MALPNVLVSSWLGRGNLHWFSLWDKFSLSSVHLYILPGPSNQRLLTIRPGHKGLASHCNRSKRQHVWVYYYNYCTYSDQLKLVQLAAEAKFCCREKEFHELKVIPCCIKWIFIATCHPDVLQCPVIYCVRALKQLRYMYSLVHPPHCKNCDNIPLLLPDKITHAIFYS